MLAAVLLAAATARAADKEYSVRGMVLRVDAPSRSFTVSHDRIDGFMEAMTMPFEVRDARELQGLSPGAVVTFTLVVGEKAAYARRITVQRYQSVELDPLTADRLSVMRRATRAAAKPLAAGAPVPEFTLTDQHGARVSFSSLAGKVVAVNFVYTRCALPQFCLRMTNHFSALQTRFGSRLGRDLVLLTITFDPVRDTPEVMAAYAGQWQPVRGGWRFLTGEPGDVRRVCDLFGVEAFPDDGLVSHSLRTAVIDRRGRLVANVAGNEFTSQQLGDLVAATLGR
jgi:protein SCO1/2